MPETENKPTDRSSQIRIAVISGVIASLIIIIFIQPLLRLAWSGIQTLGSYFFHEYLNSIYRQAALGHCNDVDIILLMIILSGFSGLMLGIAVALTRLILCPAKKHKNLIFRKHHVAIHMVIIFFAFRFSAFNSDRPIRLS